MVSVKDDQLYCVDYSAEDDAGTNIDVVPHLSSHELIMHTNDSYAYIVKPVILAGDITNDPYPVDSVHKFDFIKALNDYYSDHKPIYAGEYICFVYRLTSIPVNSNGNNFKCLYSDLLFLKFIEEWFGSSMSEATVGNKSHLDFNIAAQKRELLTLMHNVPVVVVNQIVSVIQALYLKIYFQEDLIRSFNYFRTAVDIDKFRLCLHLIDAPPLAQKKLKKYIQNVDLFKTYAKPLAARYSDRLSSFKFPPGLIFLYDTPTELSARSDYYEIGAKAVLNLADHGLDRALLQELIFPAISDDYVSQRTTFLSTNGFRDLAFAPFEAIFKPKDTDPYYSTWCSHALSQLDKYDAYLEEKPKNAAKPSLSSDSSAKSRSRTGFQRRVKDIKNKLNKSGWTSLVVKADDRGLNAAEKQAVIEKKQDEFSKCIVEGLGSFIFCYAIKPTIEFSNKLNMFAGRVSLVSCRDKLHEVIPGDIPEEKEYVSNDDPLLVRARADYLYEESDAPVFEDDYDD